MTIQEFLRELSGEDKAAGELLQSMTALQQRTATRLAGLLGDLDIQAGRLAATEANIAKVAEIMGELERGFADPKWQEAVSKYLSSFDAINATVVGYVSELGAIDAAMMAALRQQFKVTAAEYLLSAQSFSARMLTPLANETLAHVAGNATFRELLTATNDIITGGDANDGAIVASARTTANDLVSIYQRTATKTASDAVGAEFYLYQGSEIDTTRPFCAARAGKYWHKREIEGWADLQWDGKIPETNATSIFSLLGGYNCRHVLVPVSRRQVPDGDLRRMREAGYID